MVKLPGNRSEFEAVTVKEAPQEVITSLVALYRQGDLASVVAQAQSLVMQFPHAFVLYNILGGAYKGLGEIELATQAFKKTTELKPNYPEGYTNLGACLKAEGKLEEAISAYKSAISLNPNHAVAYNNLGNVMKEKGDLEGALTALNKAILVKADYVEAHNNRGTVLQDQGKLDEAIASYNQALSLKPDYAEAWSNLGNAIQEQGKLEEAIQAYKHCLSINPNYDLVRASLLYGQAQICDFEELDKQRLLLSRLGILEQYIAPFDVLCIEDSPERHLLRSEVLAKDKFAQSALPFVSKSLENARRIRIGYFSADFGEHPVSYLLAGVLEKHNREQFEIFGYSISGTREGTLRQRLIKSFDVFDDVSEMNDKDVALLARQDEIDIAIDLNGYTENSRTRIFAYRAAPIQINYLGYPGTMGAEFIDYIIADRNLIPLENEMYFSEKKIYLPNTYMPTDDTRRLCERSISRREFGLPEDGFVFCCFNNNYKITSAEFDIWMRLLHNVEGSVLWLRRSNKLSEANLVREAQKRNIAPSRIIFADRVPIEEHLARHKLADLFIDTFAFNAHTTVTEALWSGLPVVTKFGKGFAARVAGSLLNAIGLPELVTTNERDYEALILRLATDPSELLKVREKLALHRLSQPLFDTEKYTRHLEEGFTGVYKNYSDGKDPETIFVCQ